MKTINLLVFALLLSTPWLVGCVATQVTAPTSTQQAIANAVEDAVSIGLVPVFTKNPSYIAAAQTVALSLGSVTGDTLTATDVAAFLAKTPLSVADQRTVAGVVTAAWQIYVKRYSQQVSTNIRPDVKLFLGAVSNGIKAAAAATPQ